MIKRNKDSVQQFYDTILKFRLSNQENLTGKISLDFKKLISNVTSNNSSKAIDLGYGYGNYSLALAKSGFQVTSIDFISPTYFEKRVKRNNLLGKITVLEADLNSFEPKEEYDFIISKDVFHFISKNKLAKLLKQLVSKTNKNGYNYFVVFTDIIRKSNTGEIIKIEGEAELKSKIFLRFLEQLYANWEVSINISDYKEGNYFIAKKITIIALNV